MDTIAGSSSSASSASPDPKVSPDAGFQNPKSMNTDSASPRTLVLCFDGTANQYDGTNTNVVKFYSLLKKDSTDEQLCYYQPGIGTYVEPGVVSPLFQWFAKVADEAVAWYLDAHVRGGYQFLMQNYRPNDKICIFGFSRGAYTARALAGFIHKIGLLPKDNPEQVPLAYKLYKHTDAVSIQLAAGFKQTFCRDVKIEFVGVWDTVASVGVLRSKTLPFTTSNTTIKVFRHALSLDEHRVKFLPNLYHRPLPDVSTTPQNGKKPCSPMPASPTSMNTSKSTDALRQIPTPASVFTSEKNGRFVPFTRNRRLQTKVSRKRLFVGRNMPRFPRHSELTNLNDPSDGDVGETDVKEVWFAGCHSDVGGGSVSNATTHCLSDIPLRWMVREAAAAQCGIQFDAEALEHANIPDAVFSHDGFPVKASRNKGPLAPLFIHRHSSTRQKEREADADAASTKSLDPATDDALQPIHDELQITKAWWLLEIIPTEYTWQDGKGVWHDKWWIHCGRGRQIPEDIKPCFHESVKQRMAYAPLKYKPRAVWKTGTESYVP